MCDSHLSIVRRPEHVYAHLLRLLLHLLYSPQIKESSPIASARYIPLYNARIVYNIPVTPVYKHLYVMSLTVLTGCLYTDEGRKPVLLQLNQKSYQSVGLRQVLNLFEIAPTTESRRNLFCLIFDAEIAQQVKVCPNTQLIISFENKLLLRCI